MGSSDGYLHRIMAVENHDDIDLQPISGHLMVFNNVDLVRHIIYFLGRDTYLFVAGVSKLWRFAWGDSWPKMTHINMAVQSAACLEWAWSSTSYGTHTASMVTLICTRAAGGGHLESLQYAREERNCHWDQSTCAAAARGGHLAALQWCRAKGCPWDELTSYWAARKGQLDILRWCYTSGCPLSELACEAAAEGGHLEVGGLDEARENMSCVSSLFNFKLHVVSRRRRCYCR